MASIVVWQTVPVFLPSDKHTLMYNQCRRKEGIRLNCRLGLCKLVSSSLHTQVAHEGTKAEMEWQWFENMSHKLIFHAHRKYVVHVAVVHILFTRPWKINICALLRPCRTVKQQTYFILLWLDVCLLDNCAHHFLRNVKEKLWQLL